MKTVGGVEIPQSAFRYHPEIRSRQVIARRRARSQDSRLVATEVFSLASL